MRSRSLPAWVFFLLAGGTAASAQPYAYVSGAAADSIGVVDLQTNALVGTFPLAGLPSGLALGPNGLLFVSRSRLDSVARIDPSTGATTSIAVGTGPAGVAAGVGRNPESAGRHLPRIFVANGGSDSVSVIDPLAGTVLATLPVGDVPLDLVTRGSRLYVANWGAATVSVIDTLALSVVATVTVGRQPAGLAVHPQTGRVYVANFFDDTVSVIDPTSLSVVATIPVARRPRGLALDSVAGRLYVAGFEDGVIDVIDTATHVVASGSPSGGTNPVDLLLTPDRQRLYVAHLAAGESVRVLDASTLAPVAAITAPDGPVALAGFASHPPALSRMSGRLRGALESLQPGAMLRRSSEGDPAHRLPNVGERARTTIFDGTFAVADWEVYSAVGANASTQEPAGGNPTFWRRTTHFPGPTVRRTIHRLVHPAKQYDPASQGAITSLDAAWHHIQTTPGSMFETFVIVQDGVAYASVSEPLLSNRWETVSRRGLVATDFDDGFGQQPDFSAAGSVLSFGYGRTSFASDASAIHGIDNFLVTVYTGGGSGPGVVAFRRSSDAAGAGEFVDILVERQDASEGAITATVAFMDSSGSGHTEELAWVDGDGAPKALLVLTTIPLNAQTVSTLRLRITSVSGGATIGARDAMTLFIHPEDWSLMPLVLAFLLIVAGLSPGLVALLALPVLLLVASRTGAWRLICGRPILGRCARAGLVLAVMLLAARVDGQARDQTNRGRARLDGVELEYSVQGEGEPVVLIHNGVGVDWFAPLVRQPALARYRVLTYHRVGYAGSSRATGATSFEQEAVQARALMRHLGFERAHVVGHSSSALIALQLALDAPQAVASLALLEPALLAVPSPPQVGQSVEQYRAGDPRLAVDTFLEGTCGSDYRVALDRVLPGAFEQAVASADRFFGQELPALRKTSFGPAEARRVTQPVLAVVGARSGPTHRQRWELLREWLPASEAFTLPSAGHLLYVENPAAMAEGLVDFFARHPTREASGRPAAR